jgi:hypothetical protein
MSRPFTVRYHHLLCLPRFVGKGYGDAFCANMASVKAQLEAAGILEDGWIDPSLVTLVEGVDDVCTACPHWLGNRCESEEKVRAYDATVKRLLDEGVKPTPPQVCSDCGWYSLCKDL